MVRILMKSLEFCPDGQLGRQVHKVRVVPLNHKAKSNAPLRDRGGWGGVNPYGQPDRKISIFDNFPKNDICFPCSLLPHLLLLAPHKVTIINLNTVRTVASAATDLCGRSCTSAHP